VLKRLAAAAFVSAIAVVGIAPAGSAVPRTDHKVVKIIDWDASQPSAPGGAATHAIDWD
jgi:hypothetical protein